MLQSPAQSTRTKRAPDIGVKSGREVEYAKPAYGQLRGLAQVQDEDVCAFVGWEYHLFDLRTPTKFTF